MSLNVDSFTHTHTHTHIYIDIYTLGIQKIHKKEITTQPKIQGLKTHTLLINMTLNSQQGIIGRKRTLRADLMSIEVKKKRNWHQDGRDAAEEGPGPVYAKGVELYYTLHSISSLIFFFL